MIGIQQRHVYHNNWIMNSLKDLNGVQEERYTANPKVHFAVFSKKTNFCFLYE